MTTPATLIVYLLWYRLIQAPCGQSLWPSHCRLFWFCKQCQQCKQWKQCQKYKQLMRRCFPHLWWYFFLSSSHVIITLPAQPLREGYWRTKGRSTLHHRPFDCSDSDSMMKSELNKVLRTDRWLTSELCSQFVRFSFKFRQKVRKLKLIVCIWTHVKLDIHQIPYNNFLRTRFQLILPVPNQNPPNFKVVIEWWKRF